MRNIAKMAMLARTGDTRGEDGRDTRMEDTRMNLGDYYPPRDERQ